MSYNDCLSGREFWEDNVDLLEIRKRINAITHNEKFNVEGIDIVNGCVDYPCSGKEKAIYKFFRCITLNGHLIPAFFLIKNQSWLIIVIITLLSFHSGELLSII